MTLVREEFDAEVFLFHISLRVVQKPVHHQRKHLLTKVCVDSSFSCSLVPCTTCVFRIPFLSVC